MTLQQERDAAAVKRNGVAVDADQRTPEQRTFGADHELHPVAGCVLEQGIGALSHDQQAYYHIELVIRRRDGDVAADAMQAKLSAHIAARKKAVAIAAEQELNRTKEQ